MTKIDVVLQATGQHSWNLARGWANAARQLGLHHRTFAPKAEWGDAEPQDDDGLFDYLRHPQANLILLLGFDWHSQMLHMGERWKRRWQEAPLTKVLYIHESVVENCRLWENDLMRQAVASAAECVDLIVYNDLTDKELLEGLHPKTIWQPYGVDETVFTCTKPYADRLPKAVFRGKATPFYTSKSYRQRREYIEFLQAHGAIELLDYDSGQEAYRVILKDYNNYRIALNFPSLGRNHPTRVMEVLACGATLLTNRTGITQNDALLEHGKHVWYYANKEELLEGVRYLSSHWETAAHIANTGRERALARLTLSYQLREIIGWAKPPARLAPKPAVARRPAPARKPQSILVDGVMFQIQHGRPLGISRVWSCLLKELAETEFGERIVLLDRDQSAPTIKGIRRRPIRPYDFRAFQDEPCYLQRICDEENAALFFSTYYSWPERTPSALLLHDMIPEMRGMDLQELQWRAKTKAIEKALAYFTVSESTRRDFTQLYPQFQRRKLFLTPNAVTEEYHPHTAAEIEAFQRKHGIQKPYFLLTGMRILYKNAIQFFKAFHLLENRGDYEIVCTGGKKELEDIFLPYVRDVQCRVLFLSDEELSTAYSGAVALAYPSQYEGFGLPILEAQRSGCPVITCRNSSIPEVAGDTVLYVPEADVAAMKKAILAVQQPDIRAPLVKAGLENGKRFSWGQTGRLFRRALQELLQDAANLPPPEMDLINVPARLAYFLAQKVPADGEVLRGIHQVCESYTGRCPFDYLAVLESEEVVATHLGGLLDAVLQRTAPLEERESILSYLFGLAFEHRQQIQPALQHYIHAITTASSEYSAHYRLRVGLRLATIAFQVGEYAHARDTLQKVVLPLQRDHAEGIALLHQVNRKLNAERMSPASRDNGLACGPRLAPSPAAASAPLVSALVSTCNSARFIRGCLEDLERQTIADRLQIVVVDSGSTENEAEIIREFQKRFDNIQYLRTEREPLYAAWNRALRLARGKYLTNANTDDRHRRDAFERLVHALETNPQVTLVYADCLATTVENETFETTTSTRKLEWLDFNARDLLEKGCFVGPQPMWRREVHEEHGDFDPEFPVCGDYEFWLRLARTRDFLHLKETLGLYLESPTSVEHRNHDQAVRETRTAQDRHRAAILARCHSPAPLAALQAAVQAQPIPPDVAAKVSAERLPVIAIGNPDAAQEALRRKDYQRAWQATLAALKQRPYHPEAYLLLAEIAQAAGDSVAARQCAAHAQQLAPGWKAPKQFLKGNPRGNAKHDWLVLPEEVRSPQSEARSRLSVCLIVKNEERFLAQCLKSVRDLAHQIVVVDTGSTDRTVEIAKEHGAEVHPFTWSDDFSAARNAALEHATGDWVLVLDADEELPATSREALRKEMQGAKVMAYRLPIVDAGRENEGCSYVPRLFRNAPGLFFAGRVHEHAFGSVEARRKPWGLENRLGTARLLHHGYTGEVTRDRDKVQRNLRLLEMALAESPEDPNLVMNLGLELVRFGNLAGGLARYREAFRLASALPPAQVSPELRETLLTQFCTHLTAAGLPDQLIRMLDSPFAQSGSLTASLHFALGLAHIQVGQFSEATVQMRQCLAKRHQPGLTPANQEIRRGGPHHCLAQCLAKLQQNEAADEAFRAGLAEAPQSRPLRLDYARFLWEQGRPVDGIRLLHALVTERPDDVEAWRLGGEIALSRAEFLEFAADWTGEAIRLLAGDPQIIAQRAEVLMLRQEVLAAQDLWRQICQQTAHPRHQAAWILCETLSLQSAGAAHAGPDEVQTSRAFVEWYRRLVDMGAAGQVACLNSRRDRLRQVLPTASRVLDAVVAEVERG